MEVVPRGRGNEIIVLAGRKLHAARRRCEGSKGDREVHEFVRFVTDRDDPRVWLSNATGLELVFGHAVNNGLFFVPVPDFAGTIDGAYNVDLIVLPRLVAPVDIDDMVGVINAKDRIGSVPVDVMCLLDSLDAEGSYHEPE